MLFLNTPSSAIALIYQTLGCIYSLQPTLSDDGFSAPSIPALTTRGFKKWQLIQLLLDPDDHVAFLQNALGQFELIDPETGSPFPKTLPREVFPKEPDKLMSQWYESVSETLRSADEEPDEPRPHHVRKVTVLNRPHYLDLENEIKPVIHDGVEVIEANLDDPSTLAVAFASAQAIFAVTTMYDGAMEREVAQGKNVADAAAAVKTLEHFVWSTLPSASTVSAGRIPVPHMDGKAQVDEYILKFQPELAQKTTFYWGGFYAENVTYPPYSSNLLPSSGKYVWVQPVASHTLVPMVGDHTTNTGIFVLRILEKPDLCLPKRYVLGVVDWVTHGNLLSTWAAILSEKEGHSRETVYVHSDVNTVGQLWPGIGNELGQMLRLSEDLGRNAWTKDGITVLTMQNLDLKPGDEEGDLVSTEKAIRKLGTKL